MAHGSPPTPGIDVVLAALNHATRRAMIEQLREGHVTQSKLAKLSPTSFNSALKHIGMLERAGLVWKAKTPGGQYRLGLDVNPLDSVRAWLAAVYPEDVPADTVSPMSNADARIRSLIDSFVADLSELVRESALDAVRQALQQGGPAKPNGAARVSRTGGVRAIARARKPGAKRTPEALERLTSALLDYVSKNPGQRIEEIAAGMGTSTNDLRLPAKKLIGAKKVKTKGVKRATRYFLFR